jgi:hypothetical protein
MWQICAQNPCAAREPGHRTLLPIHHRPSRNGDRGSDRFEDPHREATRGVGPVTGTAGSESRSDRGGRHPASSSRGPLGAHTIERPSPSFRSRPALPADERGPGLQRLARERREPNSDDDPHREATRGAGPVTGTAGSEELLGEVGRHPATSAEGHVVLIPPGGLHHPNHRRLAGRGSGSDRFEDPHREAARGVGPVTGTAGSQGRSGRGGRHRFRLKAEGPL